jgi:hypothetical protein
MYLTVFLFDSEHNHEDDDRIYDTVTIRYFSDLTMAQLYSNYLNECNIANYLTNTFMNQLIPGLEQIELNIRKFDQLKAIECLSDFESKGGKFVFGSNLNKTKYRFSSRVKPWILVLIFITILILLIQILLKNFI